MKLPSLLCEDTINAMCTVARESPAGCFVEVGVYKGGSAQHLVELAQEQQRQVYLYDTFAGIPYKDDIDRHNVGDFNDTNYEAVVEALPYAHVLMGIFPVSAVRMPPVAFAHIDCDQYRAVKESAQYLESLMVKGGVMWFDDYGCLEGADRAVNELYSDKLIHVTSVNKWMVRL